MPPTLGSLKADLPIALFPVRLETRFDPAKEHLLVRIYPDSVHVDSFEAELTPTEVEWGQAFWKQTWLAGRNEGRERAAWARLAGFFGPQRAAWIAEALMPKNLNDQPRTPLSPEAELPVAPQFPAAGSRTKAWNRAPYTRVLPDKWLAFGYQSDPNQGTVDGQAIRRVFIVEGRSIKHPLNVGLSPEGIVQSVAQLRKDPHFGWMVNFEQAEKGGMGLRIPTRGWNINAPLDRLIVLGVKTSNPGKNDKTEIEQLLRAHHYTGGLGFVIQGTPTNNTKDVSSGYRSIDPDFNASFQVERRSTSSSLDKSNRVVTARALGIADTVEETQELEQVGAEKINPILACIEQAQALEQLDAEEINAVLWPGTWGYFLEQLMAGPGAPSPEAIEEARLHFIRHVRARGPLPTLRVSTQPYGVLPVVALDLWRPIDGDSAVDVPLVRFLRQLRDEVWQEGLGKGKVPRVGSGEDHLNDILAMTALSSDYMVRQGQRAGLVSEPPSGPKSHETGSQAAKELANRLGLSWIPSQIRMMLEPNALPLAVDIVFPEQADQKPDTGPTESASERIMSLLTTDLYSEGGKRLLPLEKHPTRKLSLLSIVLHNSCLQNYMRTAVRLLTRKNKLTAEQRIWEREDAASSSPFTLLTQDLPYKTSQKLSVGVFLNQLKKMLQEPGFALERNPNLPPDLNTTDIEEFVRFFQSLKSLEKRTEGVLDQLLRESLDLCSHRLDAWITSFAAKRLEQIRAQRPKGIYIGGYGWLENLVPPDAPRELVDVPNELKPLTNGAKVYKSVENQGYVHAPSLPHATTAALLRSGYLSQEEKDNRAAFAVNLSSKRVRLALTLLEGVRQGQALGTLLGYRFERGLHENHDPQLVLSSYIPAFRRLAPLESPAAAADSELNIRATTNVVDGLVLLKKFQSSKAHPPAAFPWGIEGLPSLTLPNNSPNPAHRACLTELESLEDAVDAISDLVMAESVHHVAQGNPVRAGATLDAIALGEAPPPELDVIHTPRSGVSITHRLFVLFCGDPATTTWGAVTERAKAEPVLNAWVAQLLGEKAYKAICRVEYLDISEKDSPRVLGQRHVSFENLELAPIDIVYLPEGEAEAQRSELELRVCNHAMTNPPQNLPDAVDLRLTFLHKPEDSAWPDGSMSFAEVLEVARTIRRLVTEARPLQPKDLRLPENTISLDEEKKVVSELGRRADQSVSAFETAYKTLRNAIPQDTAIPIDPSMVERGLLGLAQFGVAGAIPGHVLLVSKHNGTPLAPLREKAERALREAERRVGRLDKLKDDHKRDSATAAPSLSRDYHLARLGEVFGSQFRVMPRFTMADSTVLGRSLEASDALQGGNPLASITWLQRVARVREGALRLETVMLYGEALNEESLRLTVGQLPYDATKEERWAALPGQLSGSRLSLVSLVPEKLDLKMPLAGLMIDEWVETVPSKQETTGLSFHFDSPQSRPPQAILLAVPPDNQPNWTLETLEATVVETLQLAKLRAVDLSHLKEIDGLGAFLPALFFAQNKDNRSSIVSDLPREQAGPS